jgi:hypothetical protein
MVWQNNFLNLYFDFLIARRKEKERRRKAEKERRREKKERGRKE